MNTLAAVLSAVPAGTGGDHGSKSPWGFAVVGAVFVVVGTVNMLNPRLQYRMRSWQYKDKRSHEPSDAALTIARVMGGVFAALGVVLIIVAIARS